jgi:uncharacterized RDD family membrane protein YckC
VDPHGAAARPGGGLPGAVPGVTGARMITPEAVAVELETAGVGSRMLAAMLDGIVLGVGLLLLILALFLGGAALDAAGVPSWVIIVIVALLVPSWMLGYFIVQETLWRGRTLGKMALGLRVVTSEGGPIRFRHALIRGVLGLVDFWVASGAVAVIAVLASRNNQRLGDMAAGTLVLRERTGAAQPQAISFPPPPGLESYTRLLDTAAIGAAEYQAVRSFLLRRLALAPAARESLGTQLATQLAARVSPPAPPGTHPESFLAAVAAAYQQRQRVAAPAAPAAPPPPRPQAPSPAQPPAPVAERPAPDGGFTPPA